MSQHEMIIQEMIQQGYSASYADGYADGDVSGRAAARAINWLLPKFTKDTYRYEDDSQYRQGWEDGFRVGKGKQEAFDRAWRGY